MFAGEPIPGRYAAEHGAWQAATPHTGAAPQTQLTLVTMNVWFGAQHFDARCDATLALLAAAQPDIIALQEVTPPFLERVLQAPWVQADFMVSNIMGYSVDPYGVLILSWIALEHWEFVALPSAMGRHLVLAQATLNGAATTFASVHLESTSYGKPTRAKQLARIFPLLAASPHVVLSGDFNFCASWAENAQLDPSYHDLWADLHPDQPGYSIDTDRNLMRQSTSDTAKQVRFDRMLLRSQRPGWQAESIALFGAEPIDPATPDIYLSDHFGLISRMVWRP